MRLVLLALVTVLAGCAGTEQHTEHDTKITWCFGYCGKVEATGLSKSDREATESDGINKLLKPNEEEAND